MPYGIPYHEYRTMAWSERRRIAREHNEQMPDLGNDGTFLTAIMMTGFPVNIVLLVLVGGIWLLYHLVVWALKGAWRLLNAP